MYTSSTTSGSPSPPFKGEGNYLALATMTIFNLIAIIALNKKVDYK